VTADVATRRPAVEKPDDQHLHDRSSPVESLSGTKPSKEGDGPAACQVALAVGIALTFPAYRMKQANPEVGEVIF
jgi:hypothetical protein